MDHFDACVLVGLKYTYWRELSHNMHLNRTSATNCARLYNVSIAKQAKPAPEGWATSSALTSDHVWDGFLLLSLLEDHQLQCTTLHLPHSGEHRNRFTEAICARNARIKLFGQEELHHYCDKCTHKYTDADGIGEL